MSAKWLQFATAVKALRTENESKLIKRKKREGVRVMEKPGLVA